MSIFNSIRFLASGCARLGIMIIGLLWLGAIVTRAAGPYYVATTGDETSNGLSWAAAVLTISNGVAKATADDTVWVSNGTYYLTDQIMITNKITVQSMNGWTNTLVGYAGNAHSTRCFYVSRTGIVDGFTISNGHFIGSNSAGNGIASINSYSGGGGAYVATNGKIQNCYFVDNTCSNAASWGGGGGVCVQRYGIVSNCTFYSNNVYKYITGSSTGSDYQYGGGIFVIGGSVFNCTVISNYRNNGRATYNGGICCEGSPVSLISNCFCAYNQDGGFYSEVAANIVDCVFSNNTYGTYTEGGTFKNCLFINNSSYGFGATYACSMTNCVITGNRGGGIYGSMVYYNGPQYLSADRCVISNNVGTGGGAGVRIIKDGILRNCLIHHNTNSNASVYGGGVSLEQGMFYTNSGGIFNCTIVDNYSESKGGGLSAIGTNYIVNCIIASNRTAAAGSSYSNVYNQDGNNSNYYFNCCAPVTNTDIFAPNQGNITANPQFVDSAAGNWRLRSDSPCLNKGTNQSWMTTSNLYDLDGRARIRYGRVDMGAYETIYDGTVFTVP